MSRPPTMHGNLQRLIAGRELHALFGREYFLRGDTQDEMAYREVCVQNEYRLPEEFEPGAVVVDVGAHVGCFALACLGRGARVVCFEPEPENFELLERNLRGLDAYRVPKAIWGLSPNETIPLVKRENAQQTAMAFTLDAPHPGMSQHGLDLLRNGARVPTVTLDEILGPLTECRLLKLDCEGAEYPALMDCGLLAKCREIVGELHLNFQQPQRGWTVEAVREHLHRVGHFDSVNIEPHPVCPDILAHFWARRH